MARVRQLVLVGALLLSGCIALKFENSGTTSIAFGTPVLSGRYVDLSYSYGPETLYWPTARKFEIESVAKGPTALLRDLYLSVTTGSTDCHLCDLTFGKVLKDPQWAAFVRSLALPVTFHLRSTVTRRYPETAGREFPAAFHKVGSEPLREVISANQMNAVETLEDLRDLVVKCVEGISGGTTSPADSP